LRLGKREERREKREERRGKRGGLGICGGRARRSGGGVAAPALAGA
jgi:hypothetical protein